MLRTICIVLAIVGMCLGCGPKAEDPAPSTSSTSSSPAVAFADVQAIFTKSCANCHGDSNPKAGISLTNHAALTSGNAVVPGDAASSLIIQAMRGTNGKKQMPMNAAPLPEDEIKKVEDWINEGAKP